VYKRQAKRRTAWLASLVGTPQKVLAEADGTGHAENFARVALPDGTPRGALLDITPTALSEGMLR
jgi:threonylcarbamoyladenosine tRNA methylthiotransferase MtaB